MKKSIKIISLILTIFVICVLFNIKSISGFFQDNETLSNKLTIGNVSTEIIEEFDTKIIVPGEEFKKIVKVKNVGDSPFYVRVKILISPEKYKNELNLDINTYDWEYKNGYYYYKEILQKNKETPPLFTKLRIPQGLQNGDVFDIDIYNEAVQSVAYDENGNLIKDYYTIFEKISKN